VNQVPAPHDGGPGAGTGPCREGQGRYSPPPAPERPSDDVLGDRGFPYTQVVCMPLPPFGDGVALAGTLAPPTLEQSRGMYEAIRGGHPRNPVEVVVEYTYPELFGHAEVSRAFPADWHFRLVDGRRIPVAQAACGMQVVMEDETVGRLPRARNASTRSRRPPSRGRTGHGSAGSSAPSNTTVGR
jgi:hypothetical protein